MIRKNRAMWMYNIALCERQPYPFRFGRGMFRLCQWLWKHQLVEVATPSESVVLSAKGRAALRDWSSDCIRHGIRP